MKKVLTIADLCCLGQCSLTVALPVLSACGVEACPLPTAYLSTHSVGFEGYTRLSLAQEGERVVAHLKESGAKFDCVYSGYLGGVREEKLASLATKELLKEGGLRIVDPAMADMGKLYPDVGEEFIVAAREFLRGADVVLPNYTEAQLIVGAQRDCSRKALKDIARAIVGDYAVRAAVITGVELDGKIGAYVFEGGDEELFLHQKIDRVCHGAGDVFSSAFTGATMCGKDVFSAAAIAEEFVFDCIKCTDKEHWYGLSFEKGLGNLRAKLS